MPGNYDLADGVVGSPKTVLTDFVSGTLELTQFAPDDGARIPVNSEQLWL